MANTGSEFITTDDANGFCRKLKQWSDTLSDKEKAMLEAILAKREEIQDTEDDAVDVSAFSFGNMGGEYMVFPQYGSVKLEPQALSSLELKVTAEGCRTIGGGYY